MSSSAGEMMAPATAVAPRAKARMAGGFYVFAVLSGVLGEFLLRGRWAIAAAILAIACNIVVTLVLYDLFKPVQEDLALLAASFNLAGLACEAARLHPRGVSLALVLHGGYCLLIGYLVYRSAVVPRLLSLVMALAGLAWLTFLIPPLVIYLSPGNLVVGVLGEGALMLWLLLMSTRESEPLARGRAMPTPIVLREPTAKDQ